MKLLNTGKQMKEVFIALVINALATTVGAALLAWMIMIQKVDEKAIEYFAVGIILVSSVIGGLYAAGTQTDNRWMRIGVLAGLELLSLLGANMIIYESSFINVGYIIAAAMLGNLSAGLMKNKKKKLSRKYRHG